MDTEMIPLAVQVEEQRFSHAHFVDPEHKSTLGQYYTPYKVARFMASFFPSTQEEVTLLDPGAGIGSLTTAFLEKAYSEKSDATISCTCYEIDLSCLATLQANMSFFQRHHSVQIQIFPLDYIREATDSLFSFEKPRYSHVIMNPPYKKIGTDSLPRKMLQSIGVDTVNLYAAFISLAIEQLKEDGYLVAIIPRSFCNGVYYQSFRNHLLNNTAIIRIHLFGSRKSVFKDESVLQENIIILLKKSNIHESVSVSYSPDSNIDNCVQKTYPYGKIVDLISREKIINIPIPNDDVVNSIPNRCNLVNLGINVSTGPVVDFRNKEFIGTNLVNTVPLIYPFHIDGFRIMWPKQHPKKIDNYTLSSQTMKNLYPRGYYVIVKRFSSKEERRRIVAGILNPEDHDFTHIAFENHINLFHCNGHGLEENLAWGLLCYLNSEALDHDFRRFSGHTQVNASDLRRLSYPSKERLVLLGQHIKAKDLDYNCFESTIKEVLL